MKRFTVEREFAGTIPGARPHTRGLKKLKNMGPSFVRKRTKTARPLRGSDNHEYWRSLPSWRRENSVPQLALSC